MSLDLVIAVIGVAVTILVVVGMILITPGGAETVRSASSADEVAPTPPVPTRAAH